MTQKRFKEGYIAAYLRFSIVIDTFMIILMQAALQISVLHTSVNASVLKDFFFLLGGVPAQQATQKRFHRSAWVFLTRGSVPSQSGAADMNPSADE